jgi:hypothetical protein
LHIKWNFEKQKLEIYKTLSIDNKMKIFPSKIYEFSLLIDSSKAITELDKKTFKTESLSGQWTEKIFIGMVNENEFKVVTSKPRRGIFCVLNGKLEAKKGTIEITIHKTFKVLLSLIFIFPIIGFIISLFTKELNTIISLIIPTIMSFIIFRYIFTELAFKIISDNGLNKLIEIMEIQELKLKNN